MTIEYAIVSHRQQLPKQSQYKNRPTFSRYCFVFVMNVATVCDWAKVSCVMTIASYLIDNNTVTQQNKIESQFKNNAFREMNTRGEYFSLVHAHEGGLD